MLATDKVELDRLLVATGSHDRNAFRRLYDLSSPKLFGTILRIIRNRAAAEEVLQDVYLRIWQNAGSFSPQTAPANAWMNSIARNRAIDVLRQKGFATVTSVADEGNWVERIAEERDREGEMIDNASLRRCLEEIDTQARDCVLLAYYEGFSREELAHRFSRPVNTIKTWLHRSLAALRTCIDGASR